MDRQCRCRAKDVGSAGQGKAVRAIVTLTLIQLWFSYPQSLDEVITHHAYVLTLTNTSLSIYRMVKSHSW